MELFTAYCPRCDRPYTSTSPEKAFSKMEKHLKKHPDYDPDLQGEVDSE